jgi:hypothetical protein
MIVFLGTKCASVKSVILSIGRSLLRTTGMKPIVFFSKKITSIMSKLTLLFLLLINTPGWAQQAARAPQTITRETPANKTICPEKLPSRVSVHDCEHYMLMTNYISNQQLIYWKKTGVLTPVKVDTNMVKSIYLDFLKDEAEYTQYAKLMGRAQFRPHINSLCAYDDTTVLGCLVTYRINDTVVNGTDTTVNYRGMTSIVKISLNQKPELFFINDTLPIEQHYLNYELFSDKGIVYFRLTSDAEDIIARKGTIKMLARLQRKGKVYSVDRILPDTMNQYLVTSNVLLNCNSYFASNGFVLMSLSNYMTNLSTGDRITLPMPDSVFNNLRIDFKNFSISYLVYDLKYNKAENKCYLFYMLHDNVYAASFKPGAKVFDSNEMLYAFGSDFSEDLKTVCMSWDGNKMVYCMKDETCLRYVTALEMQQTAQSYKREATSK